ncbi:MAG: hypothetical protein HUJ54_00165 [Erysipelotrichaceae bacterium]|nr:hypothetical protein [Erysipelotrichaceae bacterium]
MELEILNRRIKKSNEVALNPQQDDFSNVNMHRVLDLKTSLNAGIKYFN